MCQHLCSLLNNTMTLNTTCDVYYFNQPNCFIGNQFQTYNYFVNGDGGDETSFQVNYIEWKLMVWQTNKWFTQNQWSVNEVGKFSALDQIGNYR